MGKENNNKKKETKDENKMLRSPEKTETEERSAEEKDSPNRSGE